MGCHVPERLRFQHEEMWETLSYAVREGGKLGDAAKSVAKVVGVHFAKEEELVLPLLEFLQLLAVENADKSIEDALKLADKMKGNLVVFHDEHERVVIALKLLIEAAKDENRQDYLRLAVKLLLHAREEKEFIYPTAILIGNYLKLKMAI
ncbi:MAG: hypothetical protein ACYDG2_17525 [Ruminiclostridium sp.]